MQKGTTIFSRNGKQSGTTTGGSRDCFEGCRGRCYAVRWGNKKLTYVCTKGLTTNKKGALKIA
jgi:hypothetical protein